MSNTSHLPGCAGPQFRKRESLPTIQAFRCKLAVSFREGYLQNLQCNVFPLDYLHEPFRVAIGKPKNWYILNIKKQLFQHHSSLLVGGFNPFEKYSSNWIISPSRGEHKHISETTQFIMISLRKIVPSHLHKHQSLEKTTQLEGTKL